MKKTVQVLLSITAGVLISAFLAPILHTFLPFKFEKILNRLLIISIVIICFVFVRFNKEFFERIGFQKGRIDLRNWISGFLLSALVLSALVFLEFKIGALFISKNFSITGALIFSSLLTAVVVGITEEFFFRGFLYLNFRKSTSVAWSLFWTNLIYSAVHFMKSGRPLIEGAPTMWDSLRVIGASFNAFLQFGEFWPAFVGLFIFGLVLSLAFSRTKTLFLSIGIHAGAVFFLKLTSKWFEFDPSFLTLIYGGKGFYSGILGWVFIGLIGFGVLLLTKKRVA